MLENKRNEFRSTEVLHLPIATIHFAPNVARNLTSALVAIIMVLSPKPRGFAP
jgi:hypothetical protein